MILELGFGPGTQKVNVPDENSLGILTPNAVTKRLGRTREKLRDYLNERGYGYETTNR